MFLLGVFAGGMAIWYFGILPRDRFPMSYYNVENNIIRRNGRFH
jgi:hypothetical protein